MISRDDYLNFALFRSLLPFEKVRVGVKSASPASHLAVARAPYKSRLVRREATVRGRRAKSLGCSPTYNKQHNQTTQSNNYLAINLARNNAIK